MVSAVANGSVGGSLGGLLNKVSIGGGGGSGWDAFKSKATGGGSSTSASHAAGPSEVASGVTVPLPSPGGSSASLYRNSASSSSRKSSFASPSSHLPQPSPPPAPPPSSSRTTRAFPPPLDPRSYTILKEVGDGSFGTVWLADWHSELQLPPGTLPPGPSSRPEYKDKRLVAIKRMKKAFEGGWEECMKLKELRSLQQIPMHGNIIPLYDAFLLPSTKELYFVFECMEGNLYQLTKSRKGRPLASGLVASIFYQIAAGLDHIHRHGYFHRDMKPENLLITTTGLADYPPSSLYALPGTPAEKDVIVTVKLADFGLARETSSRPPYTEYVSTRWYRAPEVLLRSREYSNPVDMWALGTILVEILTLKPLFPGDSEVDQVFKICEVLGDPSPDYGVDERGRVRGGGAWSRGVKMAKDVGFAFPRVAPRNISTLFDTNVVPPQLIDCVADLLRYEPKARLTTQQCLDHAYFREVAYRYAPYRPSSSATPARPNGHVASSSASTPHSSSLSVNTAGLPNPPPAPSPRDLPPSHSNHSSSSYFKPPFQTTSDANQQLPPASAQYTNGDATPSVPRHFSIASTVSGMSQYAMQVAQPGDSSHEDSLMSFPENVGDQSTPNGGFPSPAPSSLWNGQHADPNWGTLPAEYRQQQPQQGRASRPIPAFGTHLQRRPSFSGSVAASTFYDGSIFEGIAPTRASSIMSFPVGYGALDNSPSPQFPDSPQMGTPSIFEDEDGPVASSGASRRSGRNGHGSSAPAPPPAASSGASVKSGRWGFGKVLSSNASTSGDRNNSSNASASSSMPMLAQTSSNPLKRTPSSASSHVAPPGEPLPPMDAKQAKKAAEKAAKEAEKLKREALQQASRERARAVMRKKNQLMEAADPLHSFSNHTRTMPVVDKGKARATSQQHAELLAAQQRLAAGHHASKTMPQIVEDTSRLYVSDLRHKSRRRDEDDDVHSVSSNETGHSSHRGRPFSISGVSVSSQATSASDPERRTRHENLDMGLHRVPSLSSLTSGTSSRHPGANNHHYHHYTAPSTGHSSLDHSLIKNMQSLATSSDTAGWRSPARSERSESRGARASSPRDHLVHGHEQRYSPYPFPLPSAPVRGGGLPGIQSFDQPRLKSSSASIASFASTPSVLPSYYGNRPPLEEEDSNGLSMAVDDEASQSPR